MRRTACTGGSYGSVDTPVLENIEEKVFLKQIETWVFLIFLNH